MIEVSTIKEEKNGFVRCLKMSVPFDRRHSDPQKNYGIHGITLNCILIKDKKAVQFAAYLPVYLPHVANELWNKDDRSYNPFKGMGADVGYHSPRPTYEGEKPIKEDCPYTEGECYYGGSATRAEEWYGDFLRRGLDFIWEKLETEFVEVFEETK